MLQDNLQKAAAADHLPSFGSLHQVLQHLKSSGFKIGKSKLYEDAKKGAIRISPDGSVLETEVRAYAGTLQRQDGDIQDLNDVHNRKAAKDVELTDIKIKRAQLDLDKELGKYIPRKDLEQELAARALIFENGFRHLFATRADEWVSIVGGRREKMPEFMRALNQALDAQLSVYATTKTFQVLILADNSTGGVD